MRQPSETWTPIRPAAYDAKKEHEMGVRMGTAAMPPDYVTLIQRIRRKKRLAALEQRRRRYGPYDRSTDQGGHLRRGV